MALEHLPSSRNVTRNRRTAADIWPQRGKEFVRWQQSLTLKGCELLLIIFGDINSVMTSCLELRRTLICGILSRRKTCQIWWNVQKKPFLTQRSRKAKYENIKISNCTKTVTNYKFQRTKGTNAILWICKLMFYLKFKFYFIN